MYDQEIINEFISDVVHRRKDFVDKMLPGEGGIMEIWDLRVNDGNEINVRIVRDSSVPDGQMHSVLVRKAFNDG